MNTLQSWENLFFKVEIVYYHTHLWWWDVSVFRNYIYFMHLGSGILRNIYYKYIANIYINYSYLLKSYQRTNTLFNNEWRKTFDHRSKWVRTLPQVPVMWRQCTRNLFLYQRKMPKPKKVLMLRLCWLRNYSWSRSKENTGCYRWTNKRIRR